MWMNGNNLAAFELIVSKHHHTIEKLKIYKHIWNTKFQWWFFLHTSYIHANPYGIWQTEKFKSFELRLEQTTH